MPLLDSARHQVRDIRLNAERTCSYNPVKEPPCALSIEKCDSNGVFGGGYSVPEYLPRAESTKSPRKLPVCFRLFPKQYIYAESVTGVCI